MHLLNALRALVETLGRLFLAGNQHGARKAAAASRVRIRSLPGTYPRDAAASIHMTRVAFSPRGRSLACAFSDGQVSLLDLATGKRGSYHPHCAGITALSWSPDGSALASASQDHTMQVWDVERWRRRFITTRHIQPVCAVAWSPAGTTIASADTGGALWLWPAFGGQPPVACEAGHTGAITALCWSSDGSLLLSGGEDAMICVWDGETGQLLDRFASGHTLGITALAWRPGGKGHFFVTGSADGSIKLWHAGIPTCLYSYVGHQAEEADPESSIIACTWTPDGQRIISADRLALQEWCVPLERGQALVAILVSLPQLLGCQEEGGQWCLDVSAIPDGVADQKDCPAYQTLLAVAGEDRLYLGASPASPCFLIGDEAGGRMHPLDFPTWRFLSGEA